MAENVRVVVRCRPMNRRETDMKCKVNCEIICLCIKLIINTSHVDFNN